MDARSTTGAPASDLDTVLRISCWGGSQGGPPERLETSRSASLCQLGAEYPRVHQVAPKSPRPPIAHEFTSDPNRRSVGAHYRPTFDREPRQVHPRGRPRHASMRKECVTPCLRYPRGMLAAALAWTNANPNRQVRLPRCHKAGPKLWTSAPKDTLLRSRPTKTTLIVNDCRHVVPM